MLFRSSVAAVDDLDSDDFFLVTASPLQPSTLAMGSLPPAGPPRAAKVEKLKSAPSFFDAAGLSVEQHEATSADGTKIPYFQIGPKSLPLDGSTPTQSSASGSSVVLGASGIYTLKYFSVDALGNAEPVRTSAVPIRVDLVAPTRSEEHTSELQSH